MSLGLAGKPQASGITKEQGLPGVDVTQIKNLLGEGAALLIVPPFALVEQPMLGVHILQACARQSGFEVRILYANLLLAAFTGLEHYNAFAYEFQMMLALAGERAFARSAHHLPRLGLWPEAMYDPGANLGQAKTVLTSSRLPFSPPGKRLESDMLKDIEEKAYVWAEDLADVLAGLSFRIFGCSSMFEQTNASLALLQRVKRRRPEAITLLGGANCEGPLAQGVASLDPQRQAVDYIFSGECEVIFPAFLQNALAGRLPPERILYGEACTDLDALPLPDFQDYYRQRAAFFPTWEPGEEDCLCYETSRGCWWGQKHQCTFCGLNGEHIAFRSKSAQRVQADLQQLAQLYPARRLHLTDLIMPHAYFKSLLPALAENGQPFKIHYEQKANLSLRQVRLLKQAGVTSIEAGVESLSSQLLRQMSKGVLARQNLMLLRYARVVGMEITWSLLYGFPGDTQQAYEQILALIPLIHHLPPPAVVNRLDIARFSPYYEQPEAYGVSNIRPYGAYRAVFPAHADLDNLARHFVADYESAAYQNMQQIEAIMQAVEAWRTQWTRNDRHPVLALLPAGERFLLVDTRGLPGKPPLQTLEPRQAAAALTARPYDDAEQTQWAVEARIGVQMDSWYVPLATAEAELLELFEANG